MYSVKHLGSLVKEPAKMLSRYQAYRASVFGKNNKLITWLDVKGLAHFSGDDNLTALPHGHCAVYFRYWELFHIYLLNDNSATDFFSAYPIKSLSLIGINPTVVSINFYRKFILYIAKVG
jgi:hypothetical protein